MVNKEESCWGEVAIGPSRNKRGDPFSRKYTGEEIIRGKVENGFALGTRIFYSFDHSVCGGRSSEQFEGGIKIAKKEATNAAPGGKKKKKKTAGVTV